MITTQALYKNSWENKCIQVDSFGDNADAREATCWGRLLTEADS